jgi:predicted GH43/DUF377 family glycosyl hydrolase
MKDATKILTRHIKNPLIDPEDYPGVNMMFNPSPALYDGKTILLISVVKFKNKYGGETWVAESADGINFTVNQNPFFNLYDKEYPFTLMNKHLIDNRLTKIDDTYYLITPVGNWDYSSPCGSYQYYIGAMLLDLNDPSKVTGKTYSYLLRPDADYEISGVTDNVVFPCGALADFKTDTLKLYYGAADTRICLAEGSIKDIITACLEEI